VAQVYSVNAVGYINLEICPNFSMIANQLNVDENNLVPDVLGTDVPEGTTIYKFDSATGLYAINTFEFGEWSRPDMGLAPGEGVFIKNPAAEPFTITFVGEVPQGTLTTPVPEGFSILSSQVPQTGQVDTVLGFPAEEGDTIYLFDCGIQNYSISTFEFGEWSAVPVPAVGESFFVKAVSTKDWVRDFSVND
jgi:hypothetical protein